MMVAGWLALELVLGRLMAAADWTLGPQELPWELVVWEPEALP